MTQRPSQQLLLIVYPNVGWNAADKADEFLALDDADTDVPVTSPTGRL